MIAFLIHVSLRRESSRRSGGVSQQKEAATQPAEDGERKERVVMIWRVDQGATQLIRVVAQWLRFAYNQTISRA